MLKQKWTWMAAGVVLSLALTLMTRSKAADLANRVEKLEKLLPYIVPK